MSLTCPDAKQLRVGGPAVGGEWRAGSECPPATEPPRLSTAVTAFVSCL